MTSPYLEMGMMVFMLVGAGVGYVLGYTRAMFHATREVAELIDSVGDWIRGDDGTR
jgi:hypothetical protein